MSVVRSFHDLDVYQKAYQLSLDIHKSDARLSKARAIRTSRSDATRKQVDLRKLAEGFAKQRTSSPEFRRYVVTAIGSSDEMKVWLDYSRDLGYLDAAQAEAWKTDYAVIARMLHGLLQKWK